MKVKRQTKQVQKMVSAVNEYLKEHYITDGDNDMFSTMVWLLLRADCYKGYNMYIIDPNTSIERLATNKDWENEYTRPYCFLQIH